MQRPNAGGRFRTPVTLCGFDQPPCVAREGIFLLVQENARKEGHPTAWPFGPSRPDDVRPRSLTTTGWLGAGSTRRRVAASLGATSLSLRPRPPAGREASRKGTKPSFSAVQYGNNLRVGPRIQTSTTLEPFDKGKSKGESPYALPPGRNQRVKPIHLTSRKVILPLAAQTKTERETITKLCRIFLSF